MFREYIILQCNISSRIGLRRRLLGDGWRQFRCMSVEAFNNESGYDRLYQGHIPTSMLQKLLLSLGSAAMAITAPHRGDMVATFGEASGCLALRQIKRRMEHDETGRLILQERPRINTRTVDLEYLKSLPDNTFGKEYVTWLIKNKASPDERLSVQFVDDADLVYVMQRYREIHDLCHTLLGMPTNMIGEVTVKVFEGIQTGLPMCITGGLFGPIRLGPRHLRLYLREHLLWAIRNGIRATNIMNIYFEKHWEKSLFDLRHELNIEEPPETPDRKIF